MEYENFDKNSRSTELLNGFYVQTVLIPRVTNDWSPKFRKMQPASLKKAAWKNHQYWLDMVVVLLVP